MRKDDHLIYESLVQSRAPMSDEQAAKMITDKIKGTPNLNIQNIKMYVQKYMGLTGKAPSDVDFIAAMVHDNLQNMGMGENAESVAHGFTMVSGGTDNSAEHGFDINPVKHIQASDLKSAVNQMIAKMAKDPDVEPEDIDQTFPKEYREFRKDHFVMSNDNGDWYYVFPGKLTDEQAYDRVLATGDYGAEDAEGMSDQEYHKARKDAYEGAGEELGHGPIKVQLKKNTIIDCYKAGTVQGVRFAKGTIFNCDENVGDYYECDTEEYGGVAVFPYDVTVLSGEENAESADAKKERTQRKWQMNKDRWAKWKMENPEAAAKHAAKKAGKSEDAEGASAAFHYDPMPGLMKAANEIRDILHGAANDEARTEHIIKMAQTILSDPTEYDKNEYRKMLDGLIVLLNRFIVVPMN